MPTVGELVLALLEAGVIQAEIARAAKLHQTTISKIARGDQTDVLSRPYFAIEKLYRSTLNKERGNA
jgi:hypothetical protein